MTLGFVSAQMREFGALWGRIHATTGIPPLVLGVVWRGGCLGIPLSQAKEGPRGGLP